MSKAQKSQTKSSNKKLLLYILAALIAVVLIGVYLFFRLDGPEKVRRMYYGYKSRSALSSENEKLGEPLRAIGFTNIEGGNSVCQYIQKYGYQGNPIDCTAELKSYQEFNNEASKNQAVNAAQNLSTALKENGWQQGHYEVGKWFKDVTTGTDWNPDAYHYKYFDKTFCVLDFFVAYANPRPPAVQATMRCTTPEEHPPIY